MQKLPIETGVYSIEYAYCDQLNSCKSWEHKWPRALVPT